MFEFFRSTRVNEDATATRFRAVNLLFPHLSDVDLLKRQVKKFHGILSILVHPYCKDEIDDVSCKFPVTEDYLRLRDNLTATSLNNDLPLVLFEEAEKCADLVEKLSFAHGTLYYVPTLIGDATPNLENKEAKHSMFMDSRSRAHYDFEAWTKITTTLKNIRVRHIIVGGRYMIFHQATQERGQSALRELERLSKGKEHAREWVERGLIPSACPGQVMRHLLEGGFDVSVSEASSPTNTFVATDFSGAPEYKNIY